MRKTFNQNYLKDDWSLFRERSKLMIMKTQSRIREVPSVLWQTKFLSALALIQSLVVMLLAVTPLVVLVLK